MNTYFLHKLVQHNVKVAQKLATSIINFIGFILFLGLISDIFSKRGDK